MREENWFGSDAPGDWDVQTSAPGPAGTLPLTDDLLRHQPSGNLLGWSQDAAMGWRPERLGLLDTGVLTATGLPLGEILDQWRRSARRERLRRLLHGRDGVDPDDVILPPATAAGGPLGRLQDDDLIDVVIDVRNMTGAIDLVGDRDGRHGADWGAAELRRRPPREDLAEAPGLPDDTRLWAALQGASGGTWGGCVYDVASIIERLRPETRGK